MSTDWAIRRFTHSYVSDDQGTKGKTRPPRLTPLEVMMSAEYKEWKARREELEREIELLTQEADHAHDQLVERWLAEDPALELLDYNLELAAKLKKAKWDLEINFRAKPKEVT